MLRAVVPLTLALTLACDQPPMPPVRDAAECALAHVVAREQCSPHAADPLAEVPCADAVRAMLSVCVPPSWQPPK